MNETITHDGQQLVKQWQAANQRLKQAKQEVNSAECVVANTTTTLGKWLCPEDATIGETFSIWAFGGLIQATKTGDNDYTVAWRQAPKIQ
jgi:hypothetical protein